MKYEELRWVTTREYFVLQFYIFFLNEDSQERAPFTVIAFTGEMIFNYCLNQCS